MMLGRKCSLSYEYESETNGSVVSEKLTFDDVESFRCTYYVACDVEMIQAYDRVLNLGRSKWLEQLKNNLDANKWNSSGLKHLRIFFDDGPCYEFICRSFEVLQNEIIVLKS